MGTVGRKDMHPSIARVSASVWIAGSSQVLANEGVGQPISHEFGKSTERPGSSPRLQDQIRRAPSPCTTAAVDAARDLSPLRAAGIPAAAPWAELQPRSPHAPAEDSPIMPTPDLAPRTSLGASMDRPLTPQPTLGKQPIVGLAALGPDAAFCELPPSVQGLGAQGTGQVLDKLPDAPLAKVVVAAPVEPAERAASPAQQRYRPVARHKTPSHVPRHGPISASPPPLPLPPALDPSTARQRASQPIETLPPNHLRLAAPQFPKLEGGNAPGPGSAALGKIAPLQAMESTVAGPQQMSQDSASPGIPGSAVEAIVVAELPKLVDQDPAERGGAIVIESEALHEDPGIRQVTCPEV